MESEEENRLAEWSRAIDAFREAGRVSPEDDWIDFPSEDEDGNVVWHRYYGFRIAAISGAGA